MTGCYWFSLLILFRTLNFIDLSRTNIPFLLLFNLKSVSKWGSVCLEKKGCCQSSQLHSEHCLQPHWPYSVAWPGHLVSTVSSEHQIWLGCGSWMHLGWQLLGMVLWHTWQQRERAEACGAKPTKELLRDVQSLSGQPAWGHAFTEVSEENRPQPGVHINNCIQVTKHRGCQQARSGGGWGHRDPTWSPLWWPQTWPNYCLLY